MSKNKNSYVPAHRKKSSGSGLKYAVIILIVFILAVCAGGIMFSTGLFHKSKIRRIHDDYEEKDQTETLIVATDKAAVMIMGVDEREDDVGRSDTLMVAMIDPRRDQASLISIPRDTRVRIPRYGYDKINVAYSLGGHKLTAETVEEFLDTPVDNYVLVKVPAFKRIIDAIGGVDIDVEKRMYYVDEWDDDGGLVIDLYPGLQHMDGKTAITYVRYRDEEGDIGRVERQQKFMRAVMAQVTSPSIIMRLPDVIREVMGSVETDLTFREILALLGSLREAQKNGLKAEMVPGRPLYIDEISYWIPDVRETREAVAEMLGVTMSARAKTELAREEGEYEASIPDSATEEPGTESEVGRARTRERIPTPRERLEEIRPHPEPAAEGRGKRDDDVRDSSKEKRRDEEDKYSVQEQNNKGEKSPGNSESGSEASVPKTNPGSAVRPASPGGSTSAKTSPGGGKAAENPQTKTVKPSMSSTTTKKN